MRNPERYAWMRLAYRLGIPLRQLQVAVSSEEFVEWVAFFELEDQQTTPDQYYLAQIAYILAAANSKKGSKIKYEDFILPLKYEEDKPKKRGSSEAIWGAYLIQAWMAAKGHKKHDRK